MGSSKLSSETERIVFLDYLRVFAMFLVFGVHASESVYSKMKLTDSVFHL